MPQYERRNISKNDWYFEYPTHLLLVHRVESNGAYLKTDAVKIPWRKIRASVAEIDRLAAKKAAGAKKRRAG